MGIILSMSDSEQTIGTERVFLLLLTSNHHELRDPRNNSRTSVARERTVNMTLNMIAIYFLAPG